MAFKPFKIDHSKAAKEIDPVKIFNALTLRGSVNDLWPPQVEALRGWHAIRTTPDVSIEMNTGGGKTLVGLLAAVSLARELGKLVLFACPTKQLVEQTAARAAECGIEVATYLGGTWTNESIASSAVGPCVTTHQALFNGMSIFGKRDIGAVVLDDAHAAGAAVRDCFTLRVTSDLAMYRSIADAFRPYFAQAGLDITLDQVLSGESRQLLFVPLFASSKAAALLKKILIAGKAPDATETKFAWAHLKDHIDRCVVVLSSNRIEIAPACLPTELTPAFGKGVRRVYLSATLPSPVEFYRTFGTVPQSIHPPGRSGEAQRVFLSPGGNTDGEQREAAKALLSEHKALVLAPSHAGAREWTDCANLFSAGDGNDRIDAFAQADAPEKLVLAARYDGIDLPGDACRILVLDGLPRGEALLSRYLNESLRIEAIRAATTAIRIVQAVGRIFRSNTDHGAVILVGGSLRRWLELPANRAFLPGLLQQQLDLATEIQHRIDAGDFSADDVLVELLKGTKTWDSFYSENIGQFAARPVQTPPQWLIDAVKAERQAHSLMWTGDFASAAARYADAANLARAGDADLEAWNRHFEGYCCERAEQRDLAVAAFSAAANRRASLGRPPRGSTDRPASFSGIASRQAQAIANSLDQRGPKQLSTAQRLIDVLRPETSSTAVEQALKELGDLLGVEASRPDKKTGGGPDVLWLDPDTTTGWGLESKTDKKPGSQYNKDEIGQAHNHRQWLRDKYPTRQIGLAIVGPLVPVSATASPDDDLTIIDLSAMRELARRVEQLLNHLTTGPHDPLSVEAWLRSEGLRFPHCIDSLPMTKAVDLQLQSE